MPTIAEEVLLLVLDDDTGKLNGKLPVHSLRNAISGALLMDLALNNRIDTDLHQLVNRRPKLTPYRRAKLTPSERPGGSCPGSQ